MTPKIEGFVINEIEKKGVKNEYKVIGEVEDFTELKIKYNKQNPTTFYTNSGKCYQVKKIVIKNIDFLPEYLRKKYYEIMDQPGNCDLFKEEVLLVCCKFNGEIDKQLMSECPMCKNSFFTDFDENLYNEEDDSEEMYTEIELKEQELGWDQALKDFSIHNEISLYDILMEIDDFEELCKDCALKTIRNIDEETMKKMIKEIANDIA